VKNNLLRHFCWLFCLAGLGACELLQPTLPGVDGPIGNPLPSFPGGWVVLRIENHAGVGVEVEAVYTVVGVETRRTLRVLTAEGPGSVDEVQRTFADTIDAIARARLGPQPNALVIDGQVLAERKFLFSVDFEDPDVVVFVIGVEPEECLVDDDCDDGNACTVDECVNLVCVNTPITDCVPCSQPADCDDGNACTIDECPDGTCSHTPISECEPCDDPSDCDDGNACTIDSCIEGVCERTSIPHCVPCEDDWECDDDNSCTVDACVEGVCEHTPQPECTPCTQPADCDDGNPCTVDSCVEGVCENSWIDDCVQCNYDWECVDDNPCTADACVEGVCEHTPRPECIPCTQPADCDDEDPCTLDSCVEGTCEYAPNPECAPCTQPSDCDDDDDCTLDDCDKGVCVYTDICGCDTFPGDMNGDDLLNGKDIHAFVDCYVNQAVTGSCSCADMDDSGDLTEDDVLLFTYALLGISPT
jgi:hypothetical protein